MQEQGFIVEEKHVAHSGDLKAIKQRYHVPVALEGCHTAVIDGYVIEGHVPADVITRLLRERPRITGLAVPGMPVGSPGMEVPGRQAEHYRIMTFDEKGTTQVFESR